MSVPQEEVERGYAIYSRGTLRLYDAWVLGILNRFVWNCPTETILALYRDHISNNHLEVGVGSGYFLEHGLPEGKPRVGILDINRDCLDFVEKRIERYRPEVFQENLLEPLELGVPPFRSIGVNYVFHCLPGRLETKTAIVFDQLLPHLVDDGTVFGASVLGSDLPLRLPARLMMGQLNKRGVFSNRNDTLGAMMEALSQRFRTFNVEVQGCVVLFWAAGVRESSREKLRG